MNRARRSWAEGRLAFLTDFAVLAGGQGASMLMGFVAFAFLARTLEPEAYGVVEYMVGVSVFLASVVDGGLGVAGVRRIAHAPAQLPVIAGQIPVARLVLALVSAPAMVLFAGAAFHTPSSRALVWLFAISLFAGAWRQDWLLQATERVREAALAQPLRMTLFAAVVLTWVRSPADLLAVGWAEIVSATAMGVYCVALQSALVTPFRARFSMAGLGGLMTEGAAVGIGNCVWVATQYVPLVLVRNLAGELETAWVAAAARVVGSLQAFSFVYHFNLYPTMARTRRRDRDELAALVGSSFRVVAWAGIFAGLGLTLLARPLVGVVFGDKFSAAAPALAVLAWTLPVTLLSGHARSSLAAAGQPIKVFYAQLAGLAGVVAFGIALVPFFGAVGAALASVAAAISVWIAAHVLAVREGARLPPFTRVLVPAGLATLIIFGSRVLDVHGWSAGVGLALFAALTPVLDRRLPSDVRHLGSARPRATEINSP